MGLNESSSNRHRMIINYCAPGESNDPCDVGNTMDFAASSDTLSSSRLSVGSSRPNTFCYNGNGNENEDWNFKVEYLNVTIK